MNLSIRRNIYCLYIIKFSKWFMLVIPIMAMFYQENGLDEFHLFVLQGTYGIATGILEIPSGYLADVWGRKNSIILGSILGTLGYVMYSFSYTFAGFLIAEIILGIGVSFISGTDSAMLFDTLVTANKGNEYTKYEGRVTSLGGFFETGASILGGIIAAGLYLRAPFYLQSLIAFTAVPAAFLLVEPERKDKLKNVKFMHIVNISKYALFQNNKLKSNIILSAVIGSATLTMAWSLQVFGVFNKFSELQFTGFWVGLNLVVSISALFAYKFELFAGKISTIVIIAIVIPLGYVVTGTFNLYAIPFLFIFYLVRGIATPVLKDYINQVTDSNIRATVLSVRNLIIRLIFLAIGLLIGWYSRSYGFLHAMLIIGITYIILVSISSAYFIKVNHSKSSK